MNRDQAVKLRDMEGRLQAAEDELSEALQDPASTADDLRKAVVLVRVVQATIMAIVNPMGFDHAEEDDAGFAPSNVIPFPSHRRH